jgi:hypothetical protein
MARLNYATTRPHQISRLSGTQARRMRRWPGGIGPRFVESKYLDGHRVVRASDTSGVGLPCTDV